MDISLGSWAGHDDREFAPSLENEVLGWNIDCFVHSNNPFNMSDAH